MAKLLKRRATIISAYVLCLLGLLCDEWIGVVLLRRHSFPVALLSECMSIVLVSGGHIGAVLIWVLGLYLLLAKSKDGMRSTANHWLVSALFVGLLPFPGIGCLCFTVAVIVANWSFHPASGSEQEDVLFHEDFELPVELSPVQEPVLPLIDTLDAGDVEARRVAITTLSYYATPGTIALLRQLLQDEQPIIRNDVSVALSRLEDSYNSKLNVLLQRWQEQPDDRERALQLVDHYLSYASSNLLDVTSQQFYLSNAYAVLLQVFAEDEQDECLWLKRAQIRELLGEVAEALQDAMRALQLRPDLQDAFLLVIKLAFRLHAWDTLFPLLRKLQEEDNAASALPSSLACVQWWITTLPVIESEVAYG